MGKFCAMLTPSKRTRNTADYGLGTASEPYDAAKLDERFTWADQLVEDLRTLL